MPARWICATEDLGFQEYTGENAQMIEENFQRGCQDCSGRFTWQGHSQVYVIDFEKGVQRNVVTGKERPVFRVDGLTGENSGSSSVAFAAS